MVLPRVVTNCALVASQGKFTFDTSTRQLRWEIGKIDMTRLPTLKGGVRLHFRHLLERFTLASVNLR